MNAANGTARPLGIGLIGAGIFARDAHVPGLLALLDRAHVVAVWSRTRASAESCAALLPAPVDVEENLEALLARQDVEAVDIVLPIDAQPAMVEKCLAAGKHVISEKPVATDLAEGRRLIDVWRRTGLVWMVAENYRYEQSWLRAAELVEAGAVGQPLSFSWAQFAPMTPDVKYYHTRWRMTGQVPGGFVIDAGVHHVAVMRLLMGEIVAVKAIAAHQRADLPSPDTISCAVEFASGAVGHYFVSFAAQPGLETPLIVAGTTGIVRAQRGAVELQRADGSTESEQMPRNGVEAELAAFVDAVTSGAAHVNSAPEALRDVAVILAMLESAEQGGVRVVTAYRD